MKSKKYKTPPVLFDKTQELIREIERHIDGRLLTYWNSTNGSVCHNDVLALDQLLHTQTKSRNLYVFIKSDGGTGRASLRMVHLLRQHCDRLHALIPLNCESAATMLALGADEIHMGPLAFLTAVDTFITHDLSPVDKDNDLVRIGTNELERVLKLWHQESKRSGGNPYETVYKYIHPVVVAAVDRAGSLSRMLCEEILRYHMPDARKRAKISEQLNSSYPAHSYPIVLPQAKRIGLNAVPLDAKVDRLLIDLNELYSEMGQRCRTDLDEHNYHNNEILNILETKDAQIYYQVDKDNHFRQADRTWISTNEKSTYRIRGRTASPSHSTPRARRPAR
ncbi:MAG: hypothetical protein NTV51_14155 [Verrucomicrobia bacterium]|nr:hypothetical protein [Verrucomicrobiota bacterium]